MADRISNPRPLFSEETLLKGTKRFQMGGTSAGVILDISKRGISVNGYYEGFSSDTKYTCIREPIEISWEEFDKIRESVFKRERKTKKELLTPDIIDKPTKEYLKTLPIVTINNARYYIDADKGERRSVKNPEQVFKFHRSGGE